MTNRVGTAVELDADHRRHAVVERAIRDAKHGSGLRHHPSGRFFANAAWLVLVTLAHNLLRWPATLGLGTRDELVVAKTLRRTLLALPGRLTRSARRWRLHLPARWPWRTRSRWRSPGCAASQTPAADRLTNPSRLVLAGRPGVSLPTHPPSPGMPTTSPDSGRPPTLAASLPPHTAPTPLHRHHRPLGRPPPKTETVDPG